MTIVIYPRKIDNQSTGSGDLEEVLRQLEAIQSRLDGLGAQIAPRCFISDEDVQAKIKEALNSLNCVRDCLLFKRDRWRRAEKRWAKKMGWIPG